MSSKFPPSDNGEFQPPRRRGTFPPTLSQTADIASSQLSGPGPTVIGEAANYMPPSSPGPGPRHGPQMRVQWDPRTVAPSPMEYSHTANPGALYSIPQNPPSVDTDSWYRNQDYYGYSMPPPPAPPPRAMYESAYGVPPRRLNPFSPSRLTDIDFESVRTDNHRRHRRYSSSSGSDTSDEGINLTHRHRSRSKAPSPSRRLGKYLAVSGSDDDAFESSVVYSFTQSSRHRSRASSTSQGSPSSRTAIVQSGDVELDGEEPQASPNLLAPGVRPNPWNVFESKYEGDSRYGGAHSAKLSVTESHTVRSEPLFRWVHITAPAVMDFDNFSAQISNIDQLSNVEKNGIAKLLSRVRRDCLRSFIVPYMKDGFREAFRMEPSCVREPLPADPKYKGLGARSVTWICLPHLSLEKYSGLFWDYPPSGITAPCLIPTLLQSQQPYTPKRRDLVQVICEDKAPHRDEQCLHISQMWCVLLGNSLMVTYSRAQADTICGDRVEREIGPPIGPTMEHRKISVYYGPSVMWNIPLEECQTWFRLISRFREFWPRRFELFHQKQKISAESWPSIWNRARHARVRLDLRIGSPARAAPRGRLQPPSPNIPSRNDGEATSERASPVSGRSSSSAPAISPKPDPHDQTEKLHASPNPRVFAIFMCLEGVSQSNSEKINDEAFREHLRDIEDFLLYETSYSDQRAYKSCNESTSSLVWTMLKTRGVELGDTEQQQAAGEKPRPQHARQNAYEDQIDIFNAANTLFSFFLPPSFDGPTVRKYWGAVLDILSPEPGNRGGHDRVPHLRSYLRLLAVNLTSFSELFSHAQGQDRERIAVPSEMESAWIHLNLGLVHFSKKGHEDECDRFLDGTLHLLEHGMNTIVNSLSLRPLLEDSAIPPLEIFSLMGLNLVEGYTTVGPGRHHLHSAGEKRKYRGKDVVQMYRNHFERLEGIIENEPSNRENDRQIGLISEEVVALEKMVQQQQDVFSALKALYELDIGKNLREESDTKARAATPYGESGASVPLHRTGPGSHSAPMIIRERITPNYSHSRSRTRSHSYGRQDGNIEDTEMTYYDDVLVKAELSSSDSLAKIPSTDRGGYRTLLLAEALQHTRQAGDEYQYLRMLATRLERRNRDMLDTTKFRQENAIYAFTIVTIVFLPLSAVASIFGMNTSDIRDMDGGQWIYWATAVPVTAVTVLLGLLWTGELSNLGAWLGEVLLRLAGRKGGVNKGIAEKRREVEVVVRRGDGIRIERERDYDDRYY